MTYNEFKNKYNEKYVDHDGAYGNQCWDLGQKYFIEVLGLPASVLSGCGLVSNMLKEPKRSLLNKYFDEVKTTEMHQGDVCIWEYGHIAIFDNWDGKRNNYFSQNPNPCRVISINKSGLHAFRLKSKEEVKSKEPVQPSTPQVDILDLVKKAIRGDFGNGQARKNALGSNYNEVQRQVDLNIKHGTTRWDNIKLY